MTGLADDLLARLNYDLDQIATTGRGRHARHLELDPTSPAGPRVPRPAAVLAPPGSTVDRPGGVPQEPAIPAPRRWMVDEAAPARAMASAGVAAPQTAPRSAGSRRHRAGVDPAGGVALNDQAGEAPAHLARRVLRAMVNLTLVAASVVLIALVVGEAIAAYVLH